MALPFEGGGFGVDFLPVVPFGKKETKGEIQKQAERAVLARLGAARFKDIRDPVARKEFGAAVKAEARSILRPPPAAPEPTLTAGVSPLPSVAGRIRPELLPLSRQFVAEGGLGGIGLGQFGLLGKVIEFGVRIGGRIFKRGKPKASKPLPKTKTKGLPPRDPRFGRGRPRTRPQEEAVQVEPGRPEGRLGRILARERARQSLPRSPVPQELPERITETVVEPIMAPQKAPVVTDRKSVV